MEKQKSRSELVRPIDLKPGDLIKTKLHPEGLLVVDSRLVDRGSYRIGRLKKPEWWVKVIWTDESSRIQSQTERFKVGKFDEKFVQRISSESMIPEPS